MREIFILPLLYIIRCIKNCEGLFKTKAVYCNSFIKKNEFTTNLLSLQFE